MKDKSTELVGEIQIGDVLADRYVIESLVGGGAMGKVYHAHDPLVDRPVAIKVLSSGGMGTAGRNSLINEARAAGSLSNTNVVSVYDVGMLESGDSGSSSPYIVMEFVEGTSLHEYTISDIDELVLLAEGIATGLAHAHSNGIIHRDLKPENIVVSSGGVPKLTDFGLARSMSTRLSIDGSLSGTVFYMAPEVALAQAVDARSDLYALGVVLYEKATGELPFFDPDPLAVISQHIHAPIVPPAARKEGIPPGLNSLIIDLMAKDPDERPQSAADVVERLQKLDEPSVSSDVSAEVAVLERIARGRHVGRKQELADARSAWRDAVAGNGSTLLVTGEPGIGKSRFLRELQTLSGISGARYLLGEAYEEGGASYAPITQIIRSLVPWIKGNREKVSDYVIGDLLPVSTSVAAGFPEMEIPAYDDGQAKQQRLFDGVLSLLTIFSERQPILLALEDVHWADHGTLAMLRHLARNLRNSRVLIVATYRELELDRQKPFSKVLTELNRARLARRVKLRRFDVAGTKLLLEAMFLQSVSEAFSEAIFDDTEGNPFFIEEVCKGLIESGELYYEEGRWQRPEIGAFAVPQSVRMAIQDRISQLPAEVQESLKLAAFIGRSFEYDLLLSLSAESEATMIEHLEFAEAAQLVGSLEDDLAIIFRFNHALVPETLRESVSLMRRRLIHRELAETLVSSGSGEYQRIAGHYGRAANRDKQFDNLLKAAELAIESTAFDDANASIREALELANESGNQLGIMLANEILASVNIMLGNHSVVVNAFDAAAAAWESIDDQKLHREHGLRVLTFVAESRRFGFPFDGSLAVANRALELLGDEQDDELRSRLLAARSFSKFWLQPSERIDLVGARQDALQALEIAETTGKADVISGAIDAYQGTYSQEGDIERSLELTRRRLELLSELNPREVLDTYGVLIFYFTILGRYEEAESTFSKGDGSGFPVTPRVLRVRDGLETRLFRAWGKMEALFKVVDNSVIRIVEEVRKYGTAKQTLDLLATLFSMRNLMAELTGRDSITVADLEEPSLGELEFDGGSIPYANLLAMNVRMICELGRMDEAQSLIDALDYERLPTLPEFLSNSIEWSKGTVLAYDGDERCLGIFEVIKKSSNLARTNPVQADIALLSGIWAVRAGKHGEALEFLDRSIELFAEMGVLFQSGAAYRERAIALSNLGRSADAGKSMEEALRFFNKSGAVASVELAKELFEELGGD